MSLYQNKYRVESARMRGYDYGSPGEYFVTIDTKGMKEWFGEVKNAQMIRNEIGEIAHRIWLEIANTHDNVFLDHFIVMPNHVHGIVALTEVAINRRVVCHHGQNDVVGRDANIRVSTGNNTKQHGGATNLHNPMLSRRSLGYIIRWYKGRVTFEIHKQDPDFAWQPRFYDHIIRNDQELAAIREYIRNNPMRWDIDRNNPTGFMSWID